MKADQKVLDLLNDVLTAELTAINQYFVHAKMMKNWGYDRLAHKERHESIDEMKHADEVIERILFLDGVPNMQRLSKVNVGENVPEMLKLDLASELENIKRLNDGIKMCRDLGDNGTEDFLTHILRSEEEHVDWIESQLELVKQLGEVNYLAQQIKKES
ncbi:MAG: bacterioferritin [Deltaproteobacteria bacterium]|nr:bacterioferritin [Deltaproteobacteria bacterium]